MKLYEAFAEELAQSIRTGVMKRGDRLPSVRQASARPGDVVIIESPAFYGALQALEGFGVRAIQVATHPRDGIDLAELAAALERHAPKACWLMTNFHNPTLCQLPAA